jgi:chorismate mutase
MADLMIHGIEEKVMDRLRQDAEANGLTVEQVALHILRNWHDLLKHDHELCEELRRREKVAKKVGEISQKFSRVMSESKATLDRVKEEFAKHGILLGQRKKGDVDDGQLKELDNPVD